MTPKTVGAEDDNRAFGAWFAKKVSGMKPLIWRSIFRMIARPAWDAGLRRGQELRGCCQDEKEQQP